MKRKAEEKVMEKEKIYLDEIGGDIFDAIFRSRVLKNKKEEIMKCLEKDKRGWFINMNKLEDEKIKEKIKKLLKKRKGEVPSQGIGGLRTEVGTVVYFEEGKRSVEPSFEVGVRPKEEYGSIRAGVTKKKDVGTLQSLGIGPLGLKGLVKVNESKLAKLNLRKSASLSIQSLSAQAGPIVVGTNPYIGSSKIIKTWKFPVWTQFEIIPGFGFVISATQKGLYFSPGSAIFTPFIQRLPYFGKAFSTYITKTTGTKGLSNVPRAAIATGWGLAETIAGSESLKTAEKWKNTVGKYIKIPVIYHILSSAAWITGFVLSATIPNPFRAWKEAKKEAKKGKGISSIARGISGFIHGLLPNVVRTWMSGFKNYILSTISSIADLWYFLVYIFPLKQRKKEITPEDAEVHLTKIQDEILKGMYAKALSDIELVRYAKGMTPYQRGRLKALEEEARRRYFSIFSSNPILALADLLSFHSLNRRERKKIERNMDKAIKTLKESEKGEEVMEALGYAHTKLIQIRRSPLGLEKIINFLLRKSLRELGVETLSSPLNDNYRESLELAALTAREKVEGILSGKESKKESNIVHPLDVINMEAFSSYSTLANEGVDYFSPLEENENVKSLLADGRKSQLEHCVKLYEEITSPVKNVVYSSFYNKDLVLWRSADLLLSWNPENKEEKEAFINQHKAWAIDLRRATKERLSHLEDRLKILVENLSRAKPKRETLIEYKNLAQEAGGLYELSKSIWPSGLPKDVKERFHNILSMVPLGLAFPASVDRYSGIEYGKEVPPEFKTKIKVGGKQVEAFIPNQELHEKSLRAKIILAHTLASSELRGPLVWVLTKELEESKEKPTSSKTSKAFNFYKYNINTLLYGYKNKVYVKKGRKYVDPYKEIEEALKSIEEAFKSRDEGKLKPAIWRLNKVIYG